MSSNLKVEIAQDQIMIEDLQRQLAVTMQQIERIRVRQAGIKGDIRKWRQHKVKLERRLEREQAGK